MSNNLFDEVSEILKQNIDLELIQIIEQKGTTSRESGAFMFVDDKKNAYGTVGGGENEYNAIIIGSELVKNKKTKIEIIKDPICGGDITIQFTYLSNDENSFNILSKLKKENEQKSIIYIFGGGHVAKELTVLLDYLEYKYVIWDDREEFANKNRFKNAKEIICKPYINIKNIVNITNDDFVVIMTKGHENDYEVQKELIDINPYYMAVIGSKTKVNQNRNKLSQDGFRDDDIKKYISPIGVQVGADDPKEIAISIMAEIILYISKKEKRRKYVEHKTLFDLSYNEKY